MTDVWAERILAYFDERGDDCFTPRERGFVRICEILQDALRIEMRNTKRYDELRVAAILRELGLTRKKLRVDGALRWVFKF